MLLHDCVLYTDLLKLSLGTKPFVRMMCLSMVCGSEAREHTQFAARILCYIVQHFNKCFILFLKKYNSIFIFDFIVINANVMLV